MLDGGSLSALALHLVWPVLDTVSVLTRRLGSAPDGKISGIPVLLSKDSVLSRLYLVLDNDDLRSPSVLTLSDFRSGPDLLDSAILSLITCLAVCPIGDRGSSATM